MGEVLHVNGLSVSFYTSKGIVEVLNGFNLRASRGDIIGLVGESGAGKTENFKLCLEFLMSSLQLRMTQLQDLTSGDQTQILIQKLRHSNPILEAFGNAQTQRNDTSSRYGKFVSLYFDQ